MTTDRVIIYSRLLPDIPTELIFNQQRLIYLNGISILSLKKYVYENDIIQLLVSKWYYATYR
jgi:hypothetical protein